ncbi:MAG: hypothetical protein Fur0024_1030 [Patescibacteria group bacterium]
MKEKMITSNILSQFKDNGLFHGISTKLDGVLSSAEIDTQTLISNRERFCQKNGISLKSLVLFEQVHGSNIKTLDEKDLGSGVFFPESAIKNFDGGITNKKNIFIIIKTADCIPIIGFDAHEKIIFAIHAGWRGICQGIHLKLLSKLANDFNSKYTNLHFFFGPHISQNSYGFEKVYQENLPEWKDFLVRKNEKVFMDLSGFVEKDLLEMGVPKKQIEISPTDTFSSERFWSDQKGDKERFWTIIGMN